MRFYWHTLYEVLQHVQMVCGKTQYCFWPNTNLHHSLFYLILYVAHIETIFTVKALFYTKISLKIHL